MLNCCFFSIFRPKDIAAVVPPMESSRAGATLVMDASAGTAAPEDSPPQANEMGMPNAGRLLLWASAKVLGLHFWDTAGHEVTCRAAACAGRSENNVAREEKRPLLPPMT